MITVCPPKNTFTNLNYDLMKLEGVSLGDLTRSQMLELIPQIVYDSNFAGKYSEFISYEVQDRYRSWYSCSSQISLPHTE